MQLRRFVRGCRTKLFLTAVLFFIFIPACSKPKASKETAALDEAYHSGLLTKAEYEAKKAALLAQAAARASQSTALAALDKALEAGVVTKDEYAAKRATLLANAPARAGEVSAPAMAGPASPPPASDPSNTAPPRAPSASVQPAGFDPESHSYRMKLVKVMDAQGFGQPIPSVTLLIPVDWQIQGATTWNLKDSCNTIQTHLVASGPDGRAYEQFAPYTWAWADDPRFLQTTFQQKAQMGSHACDVMAPMGAKDYLQRNLQRIRPNAQLKGFEPAQKLMDSLAQQAQQTEQGAHQYNLTQKVKYDAIKARVKYSLEGKPMEEWIIAATVTTGTLGPSFNLQSMQQTKAWSYSCVAYTAGQRSPEGQLDNSLKLFELIASTFRQNPEWQAKVTQNALAVQKIRQKGIADRSAIMAKNADDIRNIQRQTYENQSKSEDHNSWAFSQYIRGVDTYRDPSSGETVELDAKYGHAWVNNQGVYLLSDQASFDPNSVPGNTQTWTQMQVVKK